MTRTLDRYVLTTEAWIRLSTGEPLVLATVPVSHGREITAANTGLAGAGISPASLATVTGATISTPGAIVEGKRFTGTLNVPADNVTVRNCMFTAYGEAAFMLRNDGKGTRVEHCTFAPPAGHSAYEGILSGANDLTVFRCDISGCENDITTTGDNAAIVECYLHDPATQDNPTGHRDIIEVYGGAGVSILRCRLTMDAGETAPVNCAPWSGSMSVSDLTVADCYIDGGNYHVLVDLQSSGAIERTRILRNDMGGHTNPANQRYWALLDHNDRGVVGTEAALLAAPSSILWPTSGADANRWVNCADLAPNRSNQIIVP